MGAADRAGADGDRADDDPVVAEVDEAGAGADHVGDRVERPDLVEGDVEGVAAVDGRLGDGEPLEDPQRQGPDGFGEVGALEQRPDVPPGAVVLGVGDLDVAAGRREPVADHLLDPEGDRLGGDRVDGGLEDVDGYAGADEGAQQHVAARARRRVDPERHRWTRRATRAAKTPAP